MQQKTHHVVLYSLKKRKENKSQQKQQQKSRDKDGKKLKWALISTEKELNKCVAVEEFGGRINEILLKFKIIVQSQSIIMVIFSAVRLPKVKCKVREEKKKWS